MPTADEIEVSFLFDAYEDALLRNDIDAMNDAFVSSDDVLRFGIGEMQVGFGELVAWRVTAAPVSRDRRITSRAVLGVAPGVVSVDITFVNGDEPIIGRQSQTWVRRPEGWRIIRAHVSVIPA